MKKKGVENIAFNYLPKKQQVSLLFYHGSFLTALHRKNVIVLLFTTRSYFIEIYKSKKTGLILNARAFRSVKSLYKYQLDYLSFGKRLIRIDYL